MIFERICFFIAILTVAVIIGIICFIAGAIYEEDKIKKKINSDNFVIHHIPKTPVQLSASLYIPSENDIYEDINKSILIGKLAKELPNYWKLKKEYNNGLKYTAYMTVIPEDKEN